MPPTVPPLGIHVLLEGDDTAVVALSGELDIATGPHLQAGLRELLTRPPRRVVFDLAALDFVDVVGLGVLLGVEREVATRGGRVVLRRPAPLLREVVALLNLESRLHLQD